MPGAPEEDIIQRIVRIRVELCGPRGKAAFARQLGVSPSTYQSYESSRVPPADALARIADLAGVDLRWLVTGQVAPEATIGVSHPVIQRAARLLADRPNAAAALAAFVDILAQSAKFPDKASSPQDADASAEAMRPVGTSAGRLPGAGEDSVRHAAEAPFDGTDGRPAAIPHPPAQAASTAANGAAVARGIGDEPSAGERASWIPVLGRSAAGVPQFWSD